MKSILQINSDQTIKILGFLFVVVFFFFSFFKELTVFDDYFSLSTFENRLNLVLTIDVFVCTPHSSKHSTVRRIIQVIANSSEAHFLWSAKGSQNKGNYHQILSLMVYLCILAI